MILASRALFTVADDVDTARVDAMIDEVLLGRGCTALAEGQVVLIRAALVGVPFDANAHAWVRLEVRDLCIHRRLCIRPDIRLIEVEVDARRDLRRVDNHWRLAVAVVAVVAVVVAVVLAINRSAYLFQATARRRSGFFFLPNMAFRSLSNQVDMNVFWNSR